VSEFDLDGLLIEPRPDEDGWEAFLDLALERIGGERGPGVTNRQIGELEAVIGYQLPFEVGLLLVMGVPLGDGWHQWDDPESDWAAWNERVIGGICIDIEHDDFWFDAWGPKPAALDQQIALARQAFQTSVPPLFPIYKDRAVPLTVPGGFENSDGNPVISIAGSEAIFLGDLASWLHQDFQVPLPMWPAEERSFPYWSELD